MKKIVLAAVFAAFATGATAGGMDDPIDEEPVSPPPTEDMSDEDNTTSILPILLLLALAVFAS